MSRAMISNWLTVRTCSMVLALVAAAGAQTESGQPQTTTPATIVFVWEHGSGKSVIAAAHFNRLATEKGIPYRAVSRATKPGEAVSEKVKSGLGKEGMDVGGWTPKAITDEDIRRASRIVHRDRFARGQAVSEEQIVAVERRSAAEREL